MARSRSAVWENVNTRPCRRPWSPSSIAIATWNIRVYPELRVQVAATRFRVPDVCVLDRDAPREDILTRPPLICIEILSPDDTMSMLERVADFQAFGVPHIWIFDPATRTAYDCQPGSLRAASRLAAGPIEIDVPGLFADLD